MQRGSTSRWPRLYFVSIVEFDVLLADAPIKRHAGVGGTHLGASRLLPGLDENGVDAAEERETNGKAQGGDENPMLCHPEDELDIVVVPAVSEVVGEEAPGVVVVLVGEEDPYAFSANGVCVVVVAPNDAQEQGPGGGHDGDIRENPPSIVVREGINGLEEEGMTGHRAHGVIGDTGGIGATDPGWVCE